MKFDRYHSLFVLAFLFLAGCDQSTEPAQIPEAAAPEPQAQIVDDEAMVIDEDLPDWLSEEEGEAEPAPGSARELLNQRQELEHRQVHRDDDDADHEPDAESARDCADPSDLWTH